VAGAFSGYVTFASFFAVGTTALVGFIVGSNKRLAIRQRWVVVVAAVIGGVLTILTFERMAFAALLAGVVFVLLLANRRLWTWALIVVLASVTAVSAVPRARAWFVDSLTAERELRDSSRRFIWRATFRLIEEHPLFGVGKGNFRAEYETVVRPTLLEKKKVSTAHNDFLHFAAILGIPGAVLYLLLWMVVFRYFVRGLRYGRDGPLLAAIGGSVCLLLMSMFHCVFVDAEIRALLMFLWAVGLAGWYNVDTQAGGGEGQLSA
jgi:O-antigen ligase